MGLETLCLCIVGLGAAWLYEMYLDMKKAGQ